MQTELLSLSKIFTENLFRIPDYQRGYSWTTRQLKDFWTDLALLDTGRDHYTGVLTLEQVDCSIYCRWSDDLWVIESKRYSPYYVVDGQQRLTTSLILLQSLLERVGDDAELNFTPACDIRKKFIFESRDKGVSRSYIFGYERDNPSYEFLKTRIFLEASDNHEIGESTIYTHNLAAAKQFFAEQLANLDLGELEDLYTKLTQHFLFNIYTMSGGVDVFVAFETMNNRGKPLSHLELLKNRLIFLSTRLEAEADERSKLRTVVNESWKTVYHYLGRNERLPLDDDHFLYVHFILFVGPTLVKEGHEPIRPGVWRLRHEDRFKSYLLDKVFTSRNIRRISVLGSEDNNGEQSAHPLTVESIYKYSHDIKKCVQLYYSLRNPADSEFKDRTRVLLAQLNRLGWAESLPLAIAVHDAGSSTRDLDEFLASLERFLFLQFLMRYSSDYIELDLTLRAINIKSGKESFKEIRKQIDDTVAQWVAKLDMSAFVNYLARRQGYYGWRGVRYFLFEYELRLKTKSRSKRDKISWDEFISEDYEDDYLTIEHIYPQKAKNQYWKTRFDSYSVKERAALRNSLGNLLALSRPKNSGLSNSSFIEKRDGGASGAGYKVGSFSEIEVAAFDEWTPVAIAERGLRMLDFLESRWTVSLGDREQKLRILGLGFMHERIPKQVLKRGPGSGLKGKRRDTASR